MPLPPLHPQPGLTQADLARLAGVSQVTVHKALAGHPKVGKAMRERILRLAEDHGYRPNASARAMRKQRFGAVALLQSSEPSRSILFSPFLSGIHAVQRQHQLHLLLAELPDEVLTNSDRIPKILREWMCDGLLVNYNMAVPQRLVELIHEFRLPSVWTNVRMSTDCVYPDDVAGGKAATEYLLRLGHRRIAYADYVFSDAETPHVHYSTRDRFAGYSQTMREAGLTPRSIHLPPGLPHDQRLAFSARWLAASDRPTAVIAYTPQAAHPILLAALAVARLKVPRDLSLVTFHGQLFDEPGLAVTTMVLPQYEMGTRAMKLLVRKIDNPLASLPATPLPMTLVEGATSASPAR